MDHSVRLVRGFPPNDLGCLPMPAAEFKRLAFSPDSKTVAVARSNNTVCLYDVERCTELAKLRMPRERLTNFAFSPDGQNVITLFRDGAVRVWQLSSLKLKQQSVVEASEQQRPRHVPPVKGGLVRDRATEDWQASAISADGRAAAFLDSSGALYLNDPVTGQQKSFTGSVGERVGCLKFAPGGRTFAVGKPGILEIWELAAHDRRQELTGLEGTVITMEFSRDGRFIAAATTGQHAYLWDLATGKHEGQFLGANPATPAKGSHLNTVHIFPSGRALALAVVDDVVLASELTLPRPEPSSTGANLTSKELERLWNALEAQGSAGVQVPLWRLVAGRDQAVSFLLDRLRSIDGPRLAAIPQLIRDLDNDRFAVRKSADRQLEMAGELAERDLRESLRKRQSIEGARRIERLLELAKQKSLPAPRQRVHRAFEVLEQIDTPQARQALQTLRKEAISDWVRREAADSWERCPARVSQNR